MAVVVAMELRPAGKGKAGDTEANGENNRERTKESGMEALGQNQTDSHGQR